MHRIILKVVSTLRSDALANGYVLTAARESALKAATIMDCQMRLCEDQPRARVRIIKLS